MKKITAIVLAASLGGCGNIDMTRDEMLATAAGAAVGGVLGYQIGGGVLMNSLFATAGTVVGGAGAYMTIRALQGSDRAAYDDTAQRGLASAKDGQIVNWKNPETGHSGIFRPVRSFYTAEGRLCRQYRATVSFSEVVQSGVGMACLGNDGRWQVVSDQFKVQG